jgi:Scavenger receptor cysteine-rich domain
VPNLLGQTEGRVINEPAGVIFLPATMKKQSFMTLTPALNYTTESKFGGVPIHFSYDEVKCTGTETSLHNCTHNDSHNCSGGEGAGVICQ